MTDSVTPLILTPDPVANPIEIVAPGGIATVELHYPGVTLDTLMPLFDSGYGTLAPLGPIGPGYAIYDGDPSVGCDLTLGFPVAVVPDDLPDGVTAGTAPAGRTLIVSHVGSFDALPTVWEDFSALPQAAGAQRFIEIYVSDPSVTPAEECRTDLLIPLA